MVKSATTMQPLVGIIMGSDSDWQTMERCAAGLEEFRIPFEVRVLSAHRTPVETYQYASGAAERGLKVIIAAAGMAAHLAGALAAASPLPVIGVPMAAGPLNGIDALLSTVQMPSGVPVATVGIAAAGAANAAILAAQILALADPAIAGRVAAFRKAQADKVRSKDAAFAAKQPPGR
jgi:phosphoribosylaminoimidazole carboxylase PurE protein